MNKINIKLPFGNEPRSLEQTIKKQLNDFFKKNTCVAEADVKLSHGIENGKVCEIYLKTEQKNMFTVQRASSFEVSVKKAVTKLQNQLNVIYATVS